MLASKLREKVLKAAIELEDSRVDKEEEDVVRQEHLQKRLYRFKNWHMKELAKSDPLEGTDKFYTDGKTKKFSSSKLTNKDKLDIIHEVVVEKRPFTDVAA